MERIVEFGPFRLDTRRRTLTRNGELVSLTSRLLDVLCCLASAEGHHISKPELIDAVWPHVDVDENHLHVLMSTLRKALGQSGRECLVTVPGYGYRLIVTFSATATGHSSWGEPVVAILPLKNLTPDALLDAVCVALMEDLAASLSRTRWLSAVLTETAGQESEGPALIGATYQVAGSLRRNGTAAQLSVRLVDALTRALVWSDRCELEHRSDTQEWDEVITRISCSIQTAILDMEQRRLLNKKPSSPLVWGIFAQALWHFTQGKFDHNEKAQTLLERAVRLDPTFSPAHQWLAYTHLQYANHFRTRSVDQVCGLAEPAAFKAHETDGSDAGAYATLGFVAQVRGDPEPGLAYGEQALALNPADGDALRLRGACQIALGRYEEGARSLLLSTHIRPRDPLNWRAFQHLASSAHMQGDYEAAVGYASQAGRLNRHQILSCPWLISALARLGRVEEARRVIAKVRTSTSPRPFNECATARPLSVAEEHYGKVLDGMRMAGWRT